MRLWYSSHWRPAKGQKSMRICAVSPELSLFTHMKYGSRRRVQPRIRHLVLLDGCACAFENGFTEDEKCHNLMRCSNIVFFIFQSTAKVSDVSRTSSSATSPPSSSSSQSLSSSHPIPETHKPLSINGEKSFNVSISF